MRINLKAFTETAKKVRYPFEISIDDHSAAKPKLEKKNTGTPVSPRRDETEINKKFHLPPTEVLLKSSDCIFKVTFKFRCNVKKLTGSSL